MSLGFLIHMLRVILIFVRWLFILMVVVSVIVWLLMKEKYG